MREITKRIYSLVITAFFTLCFAGIVSAQNLNASFVGKVGGLPRDVVVQGNYAYVAAESILSIIDVTEPGNQVHTGYYVTLGEAYGVDVTGNYAYVADGAYGLRIMDVSDPSAPLEAGYYDTPGLAHGVFASGTYAYVADSDSGLRIIDVSNPAAPTETGNLDTPYSAEDVYVSGNYAFVADGYSGLRIIDVSNPAAPVEVGDYATMGSAQGVFVTGSYAYVAANDYGLTIVDISSPAAPVEVGFYDMMPGTAQDVYVTGTYAYVAVGDSGISVMDVSAPDAPTKVGFYDTLGTSYGIFVDGYYAYVADYDAGLKVLDISYPEMPMAAEEMYTTEPGGAYGVYVSGDYAYVADYSGLRIVDISAPETPTESGNYSLPPSSGVFVSGSYAYVVDGDGIAVIDVSNPASPSEIGTYTSPSFTNDVYVSGNYAYVADGYSDLRIIDVSNPASLPTIGSYTSLNWPKNVYVAGNYAYVADGYSGLKIIDVSNPAAPSETGSCSTPDSAEDVFVSGNYAYVADSNSGLRIIDVSNPASPMEVGDYDASGNVLGVFVSGNYAYLSVSEADMKIIDVSYPASPVEVGNYDTPGRAIETYVSGNYAYVTDYDIGLLVIESPFLETVAPTVTDNQDGDDNSYGSDPGAIFDVDFSDAGGTNLDKAQYAAWSAPGADAGTGTQIIEWTDIATHINSGSYTDNWGVDFASLSIGMNYVSVRAYDNAGNVSAVATDAFYVKKNDATPPTVADNQTGDDNLYASDPGAIFDVDFADTGGSNLDYAQYAAWSAPGADAGTGTQIIEWTDIATNINADSYTDDWGVDFASLTIGMNYISVRAYDNAGNVSTVATDVFYVKKTESIAPTVTDHQDGDDNWYASDPGAVFDVDFSDAGGSNLYYAQYSAWSAPGADAGTGTQVIEWTDIATNIDADAYTDNWGIDFASLTEGMNYVSVRAYDNAGNESTVATDAFYVKKNTLDSAPPAQSGHSPSNGATLLNTTYTIRFTTDETADCRWALTDQAYSDMANLCWNDAMGVRCDVAGLSEGSTSIYAACRDSFGNEDTAISNTNLSYNITLASGTPVSGNSLNVELVSEIAGGSPISVSLSGDYIYSAADGGLTIINVANPAAPVITSFHDTPSKANDIFVSGKYAYVTTRDDGLKIIDISDPAAPAEVSSFETYGILETRGVYVSGSYLYQAVDFHGLEVVDISDPENPDSLSIYNTSGHAAKVQVVNKYAYLADTEDGLLILDVSDPSALSLVGSVNTPGKAVDVYVSGNYAYVADNDGGLRIIDVSSPSAPFETGYIDTTYAVSVNIFGDYAFLGGEDNGVTVIDISTPAAPAEVGSYDTPGNTQDVLVSGVYAYVADSSGGFVILDVSNPASPSETGNIIMHGGARKLVISGEYAYVAESDYGLVVYNISTPSSPAVVNRLATPGSAKDVFLDSRYAYVVTETDLVIIDITTPSLPVETGSCSVAGRGINLVVDKNYAYVTTFDSGLLIFDVSDPNAPVQISQYDPSGMSLEAQDVRVKGDYAYVADYFSALFVVNISNPASPVHVRRVPVTGSIEGFEIRGEYAFIATAQQGLRILDISTPSTPTEINHMLGMGRLFDVFVNGVYVYAVSQDQGVRIIDVRNINYPSERGYYETLGAPMGVSVSGEYAYVADTGYGFVALDPVYAEVTPPAVIDNQGGDDEWRVSDPGKVFDVDFSDAGGSYLYMAYYTVWSAADMSAGTGTELIPWTPVYSPYMNSNSYTNNWGVDYDILQYGFNYVSVKALDGSGNYSSVATDVFYIKRSDAEPPTQSNWSPVSGSVILSSETVITFDTSENAWCRWGLLIDYGYSSLTNDCDNNGTTFISCPVSGMIHGQNNVFISCKDSLENADTSITNTKLSYTIDTSATETIPPDVIDNQGSDDNWHASDPGAVFDVDFSDAGGSNLDYAQYAAWSGPGADAGTGTQIIGWTDIATNIDTDSYTDNWGVDFATLTLGVNYISVRAYDNAGNASAVATDVFYIKKDTTHPADILYVYDGDGEDIETSTSTTEFSMNWSSSSDTESGVAAYYVCIGTEQGSTDTLDWTNAGNVAATTVTGLSLASGTTYYASVKAVNGAGLLSETASSNGVLITQEATNTTTTPPGDISYVYDGKGTDIDVTTDGTRLSANWAVASDPVNGIVSYWYSIGTATGATNVVDWTDNGVNTTVTRDGLSVEAGQTYYCNVKAESGAGLFSNVAYSDGQAYAPAASGTVVPPDDVWGTGGSCKQNASFDAGAVFGSATVSIVYYDNGSYVFADMTGDVSLEHAKGFFIVSSDASEIVLPDTGDEYAEDSFTLNLDKGWNLFANPYCQPISWGSGNAEMDCGGVTQDAVNLAIYSYDGEQNNYNKIDLNSGYYILPYMAYFINAPDDGCVLKISQ